MLRISFKPAIMSLLVIAAPAAHAAFVIDWINKGSSGFDAAEAAVIDTAIGSWERLITDTDGDSFTTDVFSITIVEEAFAGLAAVDPTSIKEVGMRPRSATIKLDDGTYIGPGGLTSSLAGFYVDPTPINDEEFYVYDSLVPTYGVFTKPTSRRRALDLLSAVTHELGHAIGFAEGYTKWDEATDNVTGLLNYDGINSVALLGIANANQLSHVSCGGGAYDLMCSAGTFNNPGVVGGGDGGYWDRRYQSELDLAILEGVYGYSVDRDALRFIGAQPTVVPVPGAAAMLSSTLLLLFAVSRRQHPRMAA